MGTISLTLSTTRQIDISLYFTDNKRVRGLYGNRSISKNARRSTTEQIEPRKLITPATQEATCGTDVTSARRSTPCIASAGSANSNSKREKIRYCPTTTVAAFSLGAFVPT